MRTAILFTTMLVSAFAWARPEADHKAALLADERTAFDKAKPVFEAHCAGCHAKDGKHASDKKLDHFDMSSYPFGGHHAGTLGPTMRKVLAIDGGKATMPDDKPGSLTADERALVAAWAKAWDAAQAGGAHPSVPHHHDHDDDDHDHHDD